MTLDRIRIRRDTAANWTSFNPILSQGEPALETDTDNQKMGDGITPWNSLAYDPTIATVITVTDNGDGTSTISGVI